MIQKGNFSGNAKQCLALGKEKFFELHRGKYNGDLEELWKLIEAEAHPEADIKPPQNKVERAPKTRETK